MIRRDFDDAYSRGQRGEMLPMGDPSQYDSDGFLSRRRDGGPGSADRSSSGNDYWKAFKIGLIVAFVVAAAATLSGKHPLGGPLPDRYTTGGR